jgi:hypothetical protein
MVLAIAYTAVSTGAALLLFLYGAFDCYESCSDERNPSWPDDATAWQWDAISWLGIASEVAAIVFVVLVFFVSGRFAALALAANVGFALAGGIFEQATGNVSISLVVLVAAGLAALGGGLIRARASASSSRAGARGTRAGPIS